MKSARLLVAVVGLGFASQAPGGGMSNELLLSSAWCSFSYNKTTGYSSTKRVAFSPNGTYAAGSRAEGYSSGSGGSMASQRDGGTRGQWRVQNGELYMSEGGQWEQVQTMLRRNNNGHPIIVADGVEFSQCR